MMKMASASTIFLLLLCCSVIVPADSTSQCNKYAAAGADFVVPLKSKLKDPYILTWRHNDKAIFTRRDGKVKPGKPEDVDASGSLKLRNLTFNQTGSYRPEVFDKDRKAEQNLATTRLCVIDPVSEPRVVAKCEESNEKVAFTCMINDKDIPQKKNLTVAWSSNDKVIDKKNDWTLKFDAKSVEYAKITCKISNLAMSKGSQPVTQPCYKSNEVYGISIWVFVGGGAGIVVVLIVVVIICCIRTRRMKRMRLKGEGEFRLQWTDTGRHPHDRHRHHQHNQPSGHHHHHHHQHQQQQQQQQHPHQQQPAGHTGPRPSRSRQHRDQQRPPVPKTPGSGQPLPTPRGAAIKGPRPAANADTEQPPPLPQPRKKVPRAQRV